MEQIFYTASPESHHIHVWQLHSKGALTLLQVVDALGQVQPMVVSPDRAFLYVGVRPAFRIVAYKIDAKGKLQQAGYAPLPGSPTHISIDRKGRFIFVASYNGACVSVSLIGSDGLPEAPFQVIKGLEGCHSANIDFANQTLFVPALKQDRIYLFTLNEDGKLVPYPQVGVSTTVGVGPRHMVFHPNQHYAYCVNELNSSVDIWDVSSRVVRKVRSLDMMPKSFIGTRWAAEIRLTPDGHHLYSCDRTASIITIFSVSTDGSALTVEGYQPTETQPRSFNIDGMGQYLVAAGQKSHHIEVYKITINRGLLHPLARYPVGKGPMCVAFMH